MFVLCKKGRQVSTSHDFLQTISLCLWQITGTLLIFFSVSTWLIVCLYCEILPCVFLWPCLLICSVFMSEIGFERGIFWHRNVSPLLIKPASCQPPQPHLSSVGHRKCCLAAAQTVLGYDCALLVVRLCAVLTWWWRTDSRLSIPGISRLWLNWDGSLQFSQEPLIGCYDRTKLLYILTHCFLEGPF